MSDAIEKHNAQGDFLVTPQRALDQLKTVQAVVKEVMKKDEHYGVIPGTGKPTLLKPGAELLNNMYGYYLDGLDIIEKTEQWEVPIEATSFPLFRYIVRCILKNAQGITVSTGIGECNSYEDKYRWRKAARKCPKCGKETIIKGKAEYGGGFLCYKNKGGCGVKFGDNDPTITSQQEGRLPNERIHDQINTLLKMAKKRSFIDATLSATRTSGMFTQDMEDFAGLSDIQEAEYVEAPQEQSQEFDPSKEYIGFGKYSGSLWSETPKDYLEWLVKNAKKKEDGHKAEATIKWFDIQQPAPQGDVTDEMFPEPNQVPLFDVLCSQLNEVAHTYDPAELVKWGEANKEKIKTLKKQEQDVLRKSYRAAMQDSEKAQRGAEAQ